MAYKSKKARGVSLVELITAIGLIGLVSIMVISIYITHFRLFSNQSQSIDLANENRLALDEMAIQIKEAQAIVSTCTYPACSGYTTSATTIVLQLWPLDANGNPTDPGSSNYDYVVYKRDDLENTKLVKITYPATISTKKAGTDVLASDVSNLTFAYYNPFPTVSPDPTQATEVNVSLTNTNTNMGKTNTITQSTEAVLRNK
ncbi:MAG: hypothetical protein ACD_52C00128G0002 [uncultured bacterium]|nr:MAG: hypothetical protein ACD_52C00128G0002 [uncultured bacterium]